jgi:DUF1680 family protein
MLRRDRNRAYLNRLTTPNLLFSYYFEAGLISLIDRPLHLHGGWDSVTSEIRGAVAGHWLSAAAHLYAETGDVFLKARADHMVAEIARCQQENGGEWAFSIPEKYLYWLKRGKRKWAPQYVCHKTMLGLLDMFLFTGNAQALDVLHRCADWFYRFTGDVSREQMTEMMDFEETGGLMEHWANLYAVTGDERHLELMRRYERPSLYEPLEQGIDVLSNMHANSSIPEILGAARAYEVTGEDRYRRIVTAYWDQAVTRRGMYATGGQTCGEVWTPMGRQAARLGEMNQEHCTVFHMMRLAETLLRWTGQAEYADYYERNLYNGIFAQGYWQGRSLDTLCDPRVAPTGLVAYFLPLGAGSQKKWGSETDHFWCCHCTLMQANATLHAGIYYQAGDDLVVCQYLPSECHAVLSGTPVQVAQRMDTQTGENFRILPVNRQVLSRPETLQVRLRLKAERPAAFTLWLRRPWWLTADMVCQVNAEPAAVLTDRPGFIGIRRTWEDDEIWISLPHGLSAWPLPDQPDMVAFMDGPVVLAGLVSEERTLYGDIADPASMLVPDEEREWQTWKNGWRTIHQPVGWKWKPLNEIGNEVYTVYFPVRKR